MMLPFLRPKGWPRRAKILGESRYGFSEDDDIIEHALEEMIRGMETKDSGQFMEALLALIEVIKAKESHAPDSLENAESI